MFNRIMLSRLMDVLARVIFSERGEVATGGDSPSNPLVDSGTPSSSASIEDLTLGDQSGDESEDHSSQDQGEGQSGEEGAPKEEASIDPRDEKISALEAAIAEMREKLIPKGEEQKEEQAPEPAKEFTPEQWGQVEKEWGFVRNKDENGDESIAIDPRRLLMRISTLADSAAQRAIQHAEKLIYGNVSTIKFDSVIGDMEKKQGFSDIRQFSDAIKTYLKERYQEKDHSNPKFIEDGLYWARGKGLKNAVKKAAASMERNKTIVKPAGSAAPSAKQNGAKLSVATMTNEQRKIAEQTFRDLPKEKAWAKYCQLY